MAAPLFYNKGDQAIYNSGSKFVPQEQYRLGYTAPTTTPTAAPVSGGITNTNAFTNSGGNNFNSAGNAFGYGSQVEPVSYGSYGEPGYMGGLPGNVQQYGQGRQFVGDELGLGPTTGTNSYNKKVPGLLRSAAAFVPFGNTLLNFAEKRMNKDGRGPNNSYGVAGLSEAQKGAYNNLAGEGMLFDGPGGVKTLTGKNFTGKGYMEGQMDLAKGFGFDTMTDEEIEDAINAQGFANQKKFGTKSKGFKYKQMLEASKMYKTNKAQKEKDAIDLQNKIDAENEAAANRGRVEAYTGKPMSDYRQSRPRSEQNFTGHGKSGMGRDPDDKMAKGGRAGYFFGGRVNYKVGGRVSFKNGGLASIL